jgi:hypothetical protein
MFIPAPSLKKLFSGQVTKWVFKRDKIAPLGLKVGTLDGDFSLERNSMKTTWEKHTMLVVNI